MSDNPSKNSITIVSGLPRSGTSMMMQLLNAGGLPALTDGIRRSDIDNPRGYYEFERVKQIKQDASWLSQAEGKVVKMVFSLLYDLPTDRHYQVILMRRNMQEILASQQSMLERLGKTGGAVTTQQLAAIFQQQLDKIEHWLSLQAHIDCISIQYTDVLNNTAEEVDKLTAFLPVALNKDAMVSAVAPALYRQKATNE